ncbi:protein tyrosine phosphatase [Brevirhabdus pacifica]|uniref:Protein tyrosine phosphatase n=2 Tax=Brevirhabdus pacifica TaxID=1267768 RepID=A0A1U7DH93_9RHOB|nr:tyrosine-protein phosphatase [Brevirhabdus pacifica]APX89331.1 protein tyrosine phosphatase [Brevirhabdus pacifica]PJJ86046.1 tyrosine phosphatase family protein [Brevirhabdus pacifica]
MDKTMTFSPAATLKNIERRLRTSFGDDISTPRARFQAKLHYHLFDHAFLRVPWSNFDKVSEGVYRSNQPDHKRLERYRDMGIRTVLNLRGSNPYSPYLFEAESCEKLGLELVSTQLHARQSASPEELLHLIGLFRSLDKPFVMHCKSGADRAGLASALYQMVIDGKSVEEARKQLSLRYIHLKWTRTGICDHLFDVYEKRNAESPIGIEEWIATEYDHEALTRSFLDRKART